MKENTDDESNDEGPVEWVSYWKPNITVNLVDDFTRYISLFPHNINIIFDCCNLKVAS